MLDAYIGLSSRPAHVPREMLDSVRELNYRFLDLIAAAPGWNSPTRGASADVFERVSPLSDAQKAAASGCPYALFDLRFHDSVHWETRLRSSGRGGVAEAAGDGKTVEFVRLALFFAWHVASSARTAAHLMLGMQEATAQAFRSVTIDYLPSLADEEAGNLTARWSDCSGYWSALAGAASRPGSADLRRIQLYGLQLTAAARLT